METPAGYLLLPALAGVWVPRAPTLRADDHLCSPQSTVWENELAMSALDSQSAFPSLNLCLLSRWERKRPASHWAGSGASERRAGRLASR